MYLINTTSVLQCEFAPQRVLSHSNWIHASIQAKSYYDDFSNLQFGIRQVSEEKVTYVSEKEHSFSVSHRLTESGCVRSNFRRIMTD